MSNRVLSVHQEHEVLLKLEQAGLGESEAQAIIQAKGNALAKEVVDLVRDRVFADYIRARGGIDIYTSDGAVYHSRPRLAVSRSPSV